MLKYSEDMYRITRLEEVRHGLSSQVSMGISKRGRDVYRDNSAFPRHRNETERHGVLLKGHRVATGMKKG